MEASGTLGYYDKFYIRRASALMCEACLDEIATWDRITSNEVKQLKRDHRRTCK